MQKKRSRLLATSFDEFRELWDKLLFLGCESIFILVIGPRKFFFATSTSRKLSINFFFTDFGFIKLLRVFSIMKGDNFVIGVSSVDSRTINLRTF